MTHARHDFEIELSDPRLAKATELRALAMSFRERASEMRVVRYIDLMLSSAYELERHAEDLEHMADFDYIMSPVAGSC